VSIDMEAEGPRILRAISKALKIAPHGLCVCGSGRVYRDCCLIKDGKQVSFTRRAFDDITRYADALGSPIGAIPLGLYNRFARASLRRLRCLYPNCKERPVMCHLIPEGVLRAAFGPNCGHFQLRDGTHTEALEKVGVRRAGVMPTFCGRHDNQIFAPVDNPRAAFQTEQEMFLISLRSLAFALRRAQTLLGIDHQVSLFQPWLITRSGTTGSKSHHNIDISFLKESYTRFRLTYNGFSEAATALLRNDWRSFCHWQRSVPYRGHLFFSDLVNPSHDLYGKRVDMRTSPYLVCNVWTLGERLNVVFSWRSGTGDEAYGPLLEQLRGVESPELLLVMNAVLTMAAGKPFLPVNFRCSEDDLEKIRRARQRSKEGLQVVADNTYDFWDSSIRVEFLKHLLLVE